MKDLKYPIGKELYDKSAGSNKITTWISDLDRLPDRLINAVTGLSEEQLSTPYRKGGWNVRQVVHHLGDSHMNGFLRVKFLLTQDEPTIRAYNEKKWAELRDSDLPVEFSLDILKGVHKRWVRLLEFVTDDDWNRTLNHPENGIMDLKRITAHYAWHGNHHLAHITTLKERKGW